MDYIYAPCEFKTDDNGTGLIKGYGSTFGNLDSYGDTVAKGAFLQSIADSKSGKTEWPVMLSQHSENLPIGVWTGMEEDNHGLKLTGKLALNTTKGRDAFELLRMKPRSAISGLSIGYKVRGAENHRNKSGPGGASRTLKNVNLIECSLVTFPADKMARVTSVKSSWFEDKPVDDAEILKQWRLREIELMKATGNRSGRWR